ncbi:Cytochrome P450 monooxygenase eqxH [Colletotrichum spinosum]|uniref:Cytochrome P450 monooxygenase eqxH n=1 Tax=Colletotrichum spinosum TaxID=1347390 RepID=A0A4R8QJL9_9PEZI|nr:Cytochrome P450 monooxygenase eqxH [Colletotrichum spinosum]
MRIGQQTSHGRIFPHGKDLMIQARSSLGKRPYKIYSEWVSNVVLPPDFIHELRNEPRLGFMMPTNDDSHGYIHSFEPFVAKERHPKVATKYSTRALTKLTKPISDEVTLVLRQTLTDARSFRMAHHCSTRGQIFTRMSTRVFMAEKLCREEHWAKAFSDYATTGFSVSCVLNQYPRWFRPVNHWFLPPCWKVRGLLHETRRVVESHLKKRSAAVDKATLFDDAIEWFEQAFDGDYGPATQQVTLSLVAVRRTSDLLQQTMVDLACHPELFQPLREGSAQKS